MAVWFWCEAPGEKRNKNGEDDVKPECTLIAYLHAKPEKRAELLKILHDFVTPTRAEAGCI